MLGRGHSRFLSRRHEGGRTLSTIEEGELDRRRKGVRESFRKSVSAQIYAAEKEA